MKGVAKLAPGPGNVAYAERPDVVAGPGEVVIDLLAAGICGTDLHIEAGEYPSVPPRDDGPRVLRRRGRARGRRRSPPGWARA